MSFFNKAGKQSMQTLEDALFKLNLSDLSFPTVSSDFRLKMNESLYFILLFFWITLSLLVDDSFNLYQVQREIL